MNAATVEGCFVGDYGAPPTGTQPTCFAGYAARWAMGDGRWAMRRLLPTHFSR